MLKKLVKYGNSNALVLDRAILELLNMSEGSIVKLHTDGKSLIITPAAPAKPEEISMSSGAEMLHHTIQANLTKQLADLEVDPVKKAQYEAWKPGSENGLKLQASFKPIMLKYQDDMIKLGSEEFMRDADALAEKYHGDKTSPEFMKEFCDLRIKHAPNLANFDREMRDAAQALGYPDTI